MTEQKLIWPVDMTGQYSKIILSPANYWQNKQLQNFLKVLKVGFTAT